MEKSNLKHDKEEGRGERNIEIAKNLLKSGVTIDLIAQATGLSFNEIENLESKIRSFDKTS